MAASTRSNIFIPELWQEAVGASFVDKTVFTKNSKAAQAGVVAINGTFPDSDPDHIGDLINVPYWNSIGEFARVSTDGDSATTKQMGQTKEQAEIQHWALPVEISRWMRQGVLPINGGKDAYQTAAELMAESAARCMDSLIIAAAVSGDNQLVIDKYSATAPRGLDWDLLVDGRGLLRDFSSDLKALAIHSRTEADLLKLKDAAGRPLLVAPTTDGALPKLMGLDVIVSDRLPVDSSGLSAVTSAGTTPPVITLTQTANRVGGTGPVRPIDVVIACTTLGARGTWKAKISIDGGATYSADDYLTSAATIALTDPLDPAGGLLGVTLNIASGSAAVDNTWAFKSILKHTSLLLSSNALVFWYNQKALGDMQTVPVPQADTIIGAVHLYGIGYRYKRLPGRPVPGVVKIRHNAGNL